LVAAPGPPGDEGAVRAVVGRVLADAGIACHIDAKGNVLACPVGELPSKPQVVVTAHLDEIALMVQRVHEDGTLSVVPLGGAHPWKWGEAPVDILLPGTAPLPAILGFGSVHTTHPNSAVQRARDGKVPVWDDARVDTGFARDRLPAAVRPGARVVLGRERRFVRRYGAAGDRIAAPFLDDRADLVAWLSALLQLKSAGLGAGILFAATSSEELGGHGALWILGGLRPVTCVALEIAPLAPDNDLSLNRVPTCWAADGYAPSDPADLQRVADAAAACGTGVAFHVLTRGGSDASCAAAVGHCARPITLAIPVANSHGLETMHRDSMDSLAKLTVELLPRLA
jgi:putative aminopeptidase FrvX